MRLLLTAFFCCLLVIGGSQSSQAKDGHSWLVHKVLGQAWLAAKGVPPVRIKRGMYLSPGYTLSTKKRTRVLLTRGKERIQVGPEAIMALPPAQHLRKGYTKVLHQAGLLNLTVNKRDVRHFSVNTPYLAAVVKGTQFSVDVRSGQAQVSVSRGKVGVSSHISGESVDIIAGQQASLAVNANRPTKLNVQAPIGTKKPKVTKRRSAKKQRPNFFTTVKVKGKKKELAAGSSKKTLTLSQQAERKAQREQARATRSNKRSINGRRGAKRSKQMTHNNPGNMPSGEGNGITHSGGGARSISSAPGRSSGAPGNSGNAPGHSGGAPGNSGNAPGHSGGAPGNSGNAPGHSGGAPGNSGNAPGKNSGSWTGPLGGTWTWGGGGTTYTSRRGKTYSFGSGPVNSN